MGLKSNKGIIILLCVILMVLVYLFFSSNKKSEGFELPSPEYIISDIHYINLDRSVDRRIEIEKELKKIKGIPVTRWKAVDGNQLSKDYINKICKYPNGVYTNEKRKNGEIGCYLSHKTLLEHLLKLNVNPEVGHLILEDDAIIDHKFLYKWNKLIPHLPSDWDMVYFGILFNNGTIINSKNGIGKLIRGCGTHGYMVKHSSIPKILEKINIMTEPIDELYENLFDEFNVYSPDERLIIGNDINTSIIGQL